MIGGDPAAVWAVLSRRPEVMSVAGRAIATPSDGGRALIVALKAIEGGPADQKGVEDLARAAVRVPLAIWEEASRMAGELDEIETFAAGLRLVPDGAAVAGQLGLPTPGSLRLRILGQPASAESRIAALRWVRFREAPGVLGKVRLVSTEVVPSRASLVALTPTETPTAGQLAGAYVRRLLAVVGAVPSGFAVLKAAHSRRCRRTQFELFVWAETARMLIAVTGIKRAIAVLDSFPRRHDRTASGPVADLAPRHMTCLHRSLARSQYMRRRRFTHEVILGVAGTGPTFRAHAWVEPPDAGPVEYAVIHRFRR
jgi:hypothetical protein